MYNYCEFIRGFTDYVILSILSVKDSYGYEIRKSIISQTNQDVDLSEATLYISLKRMLEAHLITSYDGYNSKGIKRVYYHITDNGLERLYQFRKEVPTILRNIEVLVLGEKYEKSN